jgi:hypothetical protein
MLQYQPTQVMFQHDREGRVERYSSVPAEPAGAAGGVVAIGGVPIEYVTSTDDGRCAADEFIPRRTPHAGIGVDERSEAGPILEFRGYEGLVHPKPGTRW